VQNQTVAPAVGRPSRIITADGAGNIKTFRYADGAYLTGARIPWVTPRPQEGFFNDIIADQDFLAVNRSRQNTFDTSVYRLDTLAEAWSIKDMSGYAFFCGTALCLTDGSAMSSHDLATGRRLWQLAGAGNFWPIIGDRLVLDDGSTDGQPILVDAGTGRPVGAPARGSTVWDYQATDSVLVLRTTRTPPDRTAVTRWDLRTGHQHLLGSVDGVVNNRCQSAGKYLACQQSGAFEVSRIG
jgi:outer membrane protein assembly factor BamB